MNLPYLSPTPQTRVTTDRFGGYDHRLKIPEGSFRDMENLSSRHYPLLSTRPRRGLVRTLAAPQGILAKDALAVVDGGTLYYGGRPTPLTGLAAGEKQLVSMGARLLIFPDKLYYNTEDASDFGSLEADLTVTGQVRLSLCDRDGAILPDPTLSASEPADPANGALWLDSAAGERRLLQFSAAQGIWVELPAVYTRVELPTLGELPRLFSRYDGVSVTGLPVDELNGEKILYALGGDAGTPDYLVLAGLLEAATTAEATVRIRRRVPDMDFVCAAQNRLWGCRYGVEDGKVLNEIYASALGDCKNFRQYLGTAADSWTASVGSDGPWTGAAAYLGRPCFFKENLVHQVTVSPIGAHRLDETVCRGVQRGSHGSLAVLGESLYYMADGEVCVWQGGFPRSVSEAFGEQRFDSAVGAAFDGRYYLSMRSAEGDWNLFVYDPALSLWHREDGFHALGFAVSNGELYAVEADSGGLWAMTGSEGALEQTLPWMAETGIMSYHTADRKYVSRYNLSLRMAAGARLTASLRYDSGGDFEEQGTLTLEGTGTLTLPIRPRRCDHLQLRLRGEGEVKIFALTRVLETGSDVP